MITTFHQKRIRGVLGVLPENEYDYDEETKPFQDIHTKRLKRIMGYGKRRAAKSKTTTSDLCVYGFDYVLKHNWIKKEEIGAVVVVTISPDHYVPHVSNIIHGEFDLPHDVVCVDYSSGLCRLYYGADGSLYAFGTYAKGQKSCIIYR